jgi:hypothetical protein
MTCQSIMAPLAHGEMSGRSNQEELMNDRSRLLIGQIGCMLI